MNKNKKHVPIRTCVSCGAKNDKQKMLRIVKVDNETTFDKFQIKDGRAFYICRSIKCIDKAKKIKKNTIKTENAEELKGEMSILIKE